MVQKMKNEFLEVRFFLSWFSVSLFCALSAPCLVMSFLLALSFLSLLFSFSLSQLVSNKTHDGYTWVIPPENKNVRRPPFPNTPTILLSTYPNSGNTFILKVWELARGIGAQAVFKEKGTPTSDSFAFEGSVHGGKIDRFFDSRILKDRTTNLTRKEIQDRIRKATFQEPVILKNHFPILPMKIENLFQVRSVLGVISTLRDDVQVNCEKIYQGRHYCDMENEEFHTFWFNFSVEHKIPFVIYPYEDLISSPLVVFRDMFKKFVPFEKIRDENITWAIHHSLPPTKQSRPKSSKFLEWKENKQQEERKKMKT